MSHFDLSSKNKQIEEYDKQTLEPDFWQDQKKAQQVIRAKNALKDIVDRYEELDLQLTFLLFFKFLLLSKGSTICNSVNL